MTTAASVCSNDDTHECVRVSVCLFVCVCERGEITPGADDDDDEVKREQKEKKTMRICAWKKN